MNLEPVRIYKGTSIRVFEIWSYVNFVHENVTAREFFHMNVYFGSRCGPLRASSGWSLYQSRDSFIKFPGILDNVKSNNGQRQY